MGSCHQLTTSRTRGTESRTDTLEAGPALAYRYYNHAHDIVSLRLRLSLELQLQLSYSSSDHESEPVQRYSRAQAPANVLKPFQLTPVKLLPLSAALAQGSGDAGPGRRLAVRT